MLRKYITKMHTWKKEYIIILPGVEEGGMKIWGEISKKVGHHNS